MSFIIIWTGLGLLSLDNLTIPHVPTYYTWNRLLLLQVLLSLSPVRAPLAVVAGWLAVVLIVRLGYNSLGYIGRSFVRWLVSPAGAGGGTKSFHVYSNCLLKSFTTTTTTRVELTINRATGAVKFPKSYYIAHYGLQRTRSGDEYSCTEDHKDLCQHTEKQSGTRYC